MCVYVSGDIHTFYNPDSFSTIVLWFIIVWTKMYHVSILLVVALSLTLRRSY
jgi:hypothetical protein